MKTFNYTIKDQVGIHARPAGQLVKLCKSFKSRITITKGDKTVSATQLMKLMGMGIKQNDVVTFTVNGPDEAEAANAVEEFMEEHL
jgi:phosphocarrier protein